MKHGRAMRFGRYDYAAFVSFLGYASSAVVIPVALVSLARDLGFSLESGGMSAGGALHFGRSILMVASMLLCGFAAGRWGKRRVFGVGVVLMACGVGISAIAPTYGVLFVVIALAGIGEGTIEALATPFVQDLHTEEPGRYINFTHAFWSIGVVITTLGSGALLFAGVSWRIVIALVAAIGAIAAAAVLLPSRRGHSYPEHPEPLRARVVWGQAIAILRVPRFWLFFAAMFVAGGGEFSLTYWAASYIQLNFGSSAWAGGFGTACFAAGMAAGRTGWGYLIRQHQLKTLIVVSALVGAVVSFTFPTLTHLALFYPLLFVSGIATAPFWPSVQSYCADRMPESDTTMLFILLSCAGIPGAGVFTWLMGVIGDSTGSLNAAFYLVPACFLVLAALVGFERVGRRRARDSAG